MNEDLRNRVLHVSNLLNKNPYYFYPIKRLINELRERIKKAERVSVFQRCIHRFLSDLFYSISSAASSYISLKDQKKLGLLLSNHLRQLAEGLGDLQVFERKLTQAERELKDYLLNIKITSLPRFKERKFQMEFPEEWPLWKKELIQIIGKWCLIEKRESPEFILKSGIRSFYFFNLGRVMSNPTIGNKFESTVKEALADFMEELKRESKQITMDVRLTKTYGESPGTIVLSPPDPELLHGDIQVTPDSPWFDRIREFALEELKGERFILIDDLTTTGATLEEVLGRLELLSVKPTAYVVLIDRSRGKLKNIEETTGVRIFSLLTHDDLLYTRIWYPEILLADATSPINFTIDLKQDTLYDICVYYHKRREDYDELRAKFTRLVKNAVVRMGTSFKKEIEINDEIFNVIINLLIMTYNTLKKEMLFLSDLNGVNFISYILRVEEKEPKILPAIIGLVLSNPGHIDQLLDVISVNWHILKEKLYKYIRIYRKMVGKEKYTEEELWKLAEVGVSIIEDMLREEFTAFGENFKFSPEEREERKKRLYENYKLVNELFGKPKGEKVLGEKLWGADKDLGMRKYFERYKHTLSSL